MPMLLIIDQIIADARLQQSIQLKGNATSCTTSISVKTCPASMLHTFASLASSTATQSSAHHTVALVCAASIVLQTHTLSPL